MKKLSNKLLNYLKDQNHINPNPCQIKAIHEIEKKINIGFKKKIFNFFSKKFEGIYLQGSVGVGKSIILKALHVLYKNSEIFHFSDLIFHIQNTQSTNTQSLLYKKKLILIDEFYINNLTNIILFKKFLLDSSLKNKILIMTGNREITKIYNDPVNSKLCSEIKNYLKKSFIIIKMKSRVDYRSKKNVNHSFFFLKKENANALQNNLRKKLAITSIPRNINFKRKGNNFFLKNFYGNLLDYKFDDFLSKKLVFQDYVLIAKKIKFLIIRDIPQLNENESDFIYRFISLIDAFYENKNILSISTRVELDKIYLGKSSSFELKRTISRLKEMGSDTYIIKNLKKFVKK